MGNKASAFAGVLKAGDKIPIARVSSCSWVEVGGGGWVLPPQRRLLRGEYVGCRPTPPPLYFFNPPLVGFDRPGACLAVRPERLVRVQEVAGSTPAEGGNSDCRALTGVLSPRIFQAVNLCMVATHLENVRDFENCQGNIGGFRTSQLNVREFYGMHAIFDSYIINRAPLPELHKIVLMIPRHSGFPHVGIMPDDAAGRRGFLGDLQFPPRFHYGVAPYLPQSPSSALKTSLLRVCSRERHAEMIAEISYDIANQRNHLHRSLNGDNAADIGQCSPWSVSLVRPLERKSLKMVRSGLPPQFSPCPANPQCSRALRVPLRTVGFTRRFHALSSIHTKNIRFRRRRLTSHFARTLPDGLHQRLPVAGSLYSVVGRHPESSPTPGERSVTPASLAVVCFQGLPRKVGESQPARRSGSGEDQRRSPPPPLTALEIRAGASCTCSPPTKAIWVQSPARIFAREDRAGQCRWLAGLLGDLALSPTPSFQRRSIPTSITLIGFRDLDVKSRPNHFTHLLYSSGYRAPGVRVSGQSGSMCGGRLLCCPPGEGRSRTGWWGSLGRRLPGPAAIAPQGHVDVLFGCLGGGGHPDTELQRCGSLIHTTSVIPAEESKNTHGRCKAKRPTCSGEFPNQRNGGIGCSREVLRADDGDQGELWSRAEMRRQGKTRDPRENPPTTGSIALARFPRAKIRARAPTCIKQTDVFLIQDGVHFSCPKVEHEGRHPLACKYHVHTVPTVVVLECCSLPRDSYLEALFKAAGVICALAIVSAVIGYIAATGSSVKAGQACAQTGRLVCVLDRRYERRVALLAARQPARGLPSFLRNGEGGERTEQPIPPPPPFTFLSTMKAVEATISAGPLQLHSSATCVTARLLFAPHVAISSTAKNEQIWPAVATRGEFANEIRFFEDINLKQKPKGPVYNRRCKRCFVVERHTAPTRDSWRTVVFVGLLGGSVVNGFAHLLRAAQRSQDGGCWGQPEMRAEWNGTASELGSNGVSLHSWASGFASTTGSSRMSRRALLTYDRERFWGRGREWLPDAFLPTFTRDVELLLSAQKIEEGVGSMTELPRFLLTSAGSLRTLPEVTAVGVPVRVVRLPAQEHGWQFHLKVHVPLTCWPKAPPPLY
ncbi:hypothetical protein PR048_022931 [Dryococelus australis]|uniref:Uncharacterized protein n=1 Tax=Dryococelus australis TaxID=614101 RepID=A0ABQ9GSM4_9NEOP|nr:hypothetical protein PR048_022931 [Dryococelus australis]